MTRLTPAGRGAVATLAVEGAGAMQAVGHFFRPITGKPLAASSLDRIRFGTWRHADGELEEIVVCRRAESLIEIHCHGGDAAAAAIVAALVSQGAVVGDAATWLHRRYQDPLLETVRQQLADARTQRTAGILLDQLHGAWPQALGQIKTSLETGDPAAARRHLQRLIDLIPLGRHLTAPWQVVVAGQPNVGKSSLVNAMLGFSRCLVFDQPGTTRDIVVADTALDGWPIELMDTAGLCEGRDEIEAEGVERAVSKVAAADLVLHVYDATRPDSSGLGWEVTKHPNVLTVENKSDLVQDSTRFADVRTSAVTQMGVARLIELIAGRLVPSPPAPGQAVPVSPAQVRLLEELQASVDSGDVQRVLQLLSTQGGSISRSGGFQPPKKNP